MIRSLSQIEITEFGLILHDGPFIARGSINCIDGVTLADGSGGYMEGGAPFSSIAAIDNE